MSNHELAGPLIFLVTFVIAPIAGLISKFGLRIEPWPVGVVAFGSKRQRPGIRIRENP